MLVTAAYGQHGYHRVKVSKKNEPLSFYWVCVCMWAGGDIVRQTGQQKEFCIRHLINLLILYVLIFLHTQYHRDVQCSCDPKTQ